MGPSSKAAIVKLLGALLEESRGVRGELKQLRDGLEARDRIVGADLDQVNKLAAKTDKRVSEIERTLTAHGLEASPAE